MIDELMAYDPNDGDKRLTDWEVDTFLPGVDRWNGKLLPKQATKLEDIWESIFG